MNLTGNQVIWNFSKGGGGFSVKVFCNFTKLLVQFVSGILQIILGLIVLTSVIQGAAERNMKLRRDTTRAVVRADGWMWSCGHVVITVDPNSVALDRRTSRIRCAGVFRKQQNCHLNESIFRRKFIIPWNNAVPDAKLFKRVSCGCKKVGEGLQYEKIGRSRYVKTPGMCE